MTQFSINTNNMVITIDTQTNYINLMNEESIVPPEKVIVRGFQI